MYNISYLFVSPARTTGLEDDGNVSSDSMTDVVGLDAHWEEGPGEGPEH